MKKVATLVLFTMLMGAMFIFVGRASADGEGFFRESDCKANCDEKGTGKCAKRTTENVWDCKSSSGQFPLDGGNVAQPATNNPTTVQPNANDYPTNTNYSDVSNYASGECDGDATSEGGICIPNNTNLPDATVDQIVKNVLTWLLSIFATIATIAFIISGIQYLLASGSEQMMETAKRNMIYSIIGILVGLSGLVILKAIEALLGANSTI